MCGGSGHFLKPGTSGTVYESCIHKYEIAVLDAVSSFGIGKTSKWCYVSALRSRSRGKKIAVGKIAVLGSKPCIGLENLRDVLREMLHGKDYSATILVAAR